MSWLEDLEVVQSPDAKGMQQEIAEMNLPNWSFLDDEEHMKQLEKFRL